MVHYNETHCSAKVDVLISKRSECILHSEIHLACGDGDLVCVGYVHYRNCIHYTESCKTLYV